jgi:chorismate dehydratase
VWTPVRTADGSWTLRHEGHGEACHSLAGAWRQARERYAAPCRLREIALERGVVRLLDIGTGLGLDLAAAVDALRDTGARLEATTLELDRGVVEAALSLRDWPDEVERCHEPVRRSLRAVLSGSERVQVDGTGVPLTLQALFGDARETIRRVSGRFDAVFLDPFSPRIDGALWQTDFLRELAARMEPEAVLSTYSASLEVRANLARAGLLVGRGPRVGTKAEGTLASHARPLPPLDPRTARKLARRH